MVFGIRASRAEPGDDSRATGGWKQQTLRLLCLLLLAFCAAAPAFAACKTGDYAVVEIAFGDVDGGLVLRDAPTRTATRIGLIPPDATGIAASHCTGGWCQVSYQCQSGYASLKYLKRQSDSLYAVKGVPASDPVGLRLRAGPGTNFSPVGAMPYNARSLILHSCEPGQGSAFEWCLVTYAGNSGWASGRFLTAQHDDPPPEKPKPVPPPNIPAIALSPPIGCQLWHWC